MKPDLRQSLPLLMGIILITLVLFIVASGPKPQTVLRINTTEQVKCKGVKCPNE